MRQPPKTGARLYAPFQVNDAVLLCEGEKKTLAAYQAGFNAVGIGGVWNWLMHGELIEDLKAINWDGRECTIIPDSDVFRRNDLLRAIYALGRELRALGAVVNVAELPERESKKPGWMTFSLQAGISNRWKAFASITADLKAWNFGIKTGSSKNH